MPSYVIDDEWVLAVHHGLAPLEIKYNSKLYRLRPEVPTPIPTVAAHLWFGNPRCQMGKVTAVRDSDGAITQTVASREDEVRRLRLKWGLPFGDERTFLNEDGELGTPDVTLTSLDGNDEILTVIQDPLGNGGTMPGSSVPGQTDFAQIQYLAEKMRLLEERIALNDSLPDDDDADVEGDVPHDTVSASHPSFILPPTTVDDEPVLFGGALDESP